MKKKKKQFKSKEKSHRHQDYMENNHEKIFNTVCH